MYINDTPKGHIREFVVAPDGSLTGGGVWAEVTGEGEGGTDGLTALIQESIGDSILPNAGSEMIAVSLGAVNVGAPIVPMAVLGSDDLLPPMVRVLLRRAEPIAGGGARIPATLR